MTVPGDTNVLGRQLGRKGRVTGTIKLPSAGQTTLDDLGAKGTTGRTQCLLESSKIFPEQGISKLPVYFVNLLENTEAVL